MSDVVIMSPGCRACQSLSSYIRLGQQHGQTMPVPVISRLDDAARPFVEKHSMRAFPAAIIGGQYMVGANTIRRALATTYGFRT